MDVTLINTSVYDLPSSRRVGAIVYDGTVDLRLWPGPGTDRVLLSAYGPSLPSVLDNERGQIPGQQLARGEVMRMHPGKLHCDMLVWVGIRAPEPGTERAPAPKGEEITAAVDAVLRYVAGRNVVRIAFAAFGAGPGELPPEERLARIVRAAHAYEERCFAEGRSPVVEEVLVCEASSAVLAAARRKVEGLAKTALPPKPLPGDKPAERAPRAARTSSASGSGARGSSRKPRLDPDEIALQKTRAATYDRAHSYVAGDWLLHPKFGAGRVEQITPEGAMMVLFEDGEQRKMLQGRK